MASSAALLFAMASCGNPAADGKKLAELMSAKSEEIKEATDKRTEEWNNR